MARSVPVVCRCQSRGVRPITGLDRPTVRSLGALGGGTGGGLTNAGEAGQRARERETRHVAFSQLISP